MTKKTLRSVADFAEAGLVAADQTTALDEVAAHYALALSPAMAELIDANDPADPITLQFVPQAQELNILPHELPDPIGDAAFSPVAGLVHRYPDRVLLKITHICPVYCRFCFRREMVGPGKSDTLTSADIDAALAYIAANPQIWEVILTGGDPLALSARRIKSLMLQIKSIPHVKIVRFHSRVPVVSPHMVTPAMVSAMRASGKAVYVALHANHPREMTQAARAACARLVDGGIMMVSQSVLLKGINDSVEVLEGLMRAFVESRVKPYTINHGDLAPGTSHFRLSIAEGQALMRGLRGRLSGLCQPSYILDIPGGHGKSPVGPNYLSETSEGLVVEDYQGQRHPYRDTI
eukprot:gene9549-9624_t